MAIGMKIYLSFLQFLSLQSNAPNLAIGTQKYFLKTKVKKDGSLQVKEFRTILNTVLHKLEIQE